MVSIEMFLVNFASFEKFIRCLFDQLFIRQINGKYPCARLVLICSLRKEPIHFEDFRKPELNFDP